MLFNSILYLLVFLPAVAFCGAVTERVRQSNQPTSSSASQYALIVASAVFYIVWNPSDLAVLAISVAVNYSAALWVSRGRIKADTGVIAGVVFNIVLLGYFKHSSFLEHGLGLGEGWSWREAALPLAISFFTFQQISFLVDFKQGKFPMPCFREYLLYVIFWPQLIAGPIVRFQEMIGQYRQFSFRRIPPIDIAMGLTLVAIGLCKKVMIADKIAVYIDPAFANVGDLSIIDAWSAALGYSLQLYFDFSGYCDMAIGSALLFGIHLPINFNSPYKAKSVHDFWRRWHITLGAFLRDYVYRPLRGQESTLPKIQGALIITMFLSGLWHGAGFTFMIWGLLHGLAMVVERTWTSSGLKLPPDKLRWALTFLFVLIGWVFFRAANTEDALTMLSIMFGGHGVYFPEIWRPMLQDWGDYHYSTSSVFNGLELIVLIMLLTATTQMKNSSQWTEDIKVYRCRYAVPAGFAIAYIAAISISPSVFLYFQF